MDVVTNLKQALPYLLVHRGGIFVVALGSRALTQQSVLRSVAEDVVLLHNLGMRVVVVHGGGVYIDRMAERLGIEQEAGDAISDDKLELAKMLSRGKVNVDVVSALREAGGKPVGVSGGDGDLVRATRRGTSEGTDSGHLGTVEKIDPTLATTLLEAGYIPVVSSLGATATGGVVGILTDGLAARLGEVLGAAKLFFLTDRAGILEQVGEPGSLVGYTDVAQVRALMDAGTISGGMHSKCAAAMDAIERGVPKVHIIDAQQPSALLLEVFTNEGAGTLIVADRHAFDGE